MDTFFFFVYTVSSFCYGLLFPVSSWACIYYDKYPGRVILVTVIGKVSYEYSISTA
jgi:hypothetical protein